MGKKIAQVAPGLALVRQEPLWRGDGRVYSFVHEPTGKVLVYDPCGLGGRWRFTRAVVDRAIPQLSQLDWSNLDPEDPVNRVVYRDEFYRIIEESIRRAEEEAL